MNRHVLIISALVFLVGIYVLFSGKETEVMNKKIESAKVKKIDPIKPDIKYVKKTEALNTNTKQSSDDEFAMTVEDETEEDLTEEEIRKEEEKQFIRDFITSKKAQRKHKSRKELKEDFSTISGKGTGAMMSKWKRQQRKKQQQELVTE